MSLKYEPASEPLTFLKSHNPQPSQVASTVEYLQGLGAAHTPLVLEFSRYPTPYTLHPTP